MSFLQKPYNREDFLNFVSKDFLSDFSNDKRPVRTNEKSLLKEVQKLGESTDLGISVFEATCDESDHGKRVAITMDAFRILRDTATRNALIVFYSKESNKWRLSLLTSNFELDSKGKVTSKMSNPRRYSYLLGEDAKTVTPHKYLEAKGAVKDFKDLQSRFAVEVVNNDFYKEIAKLYDELVGTDKIAGSLKYPGHGEVSHQFAVRLIGRIIFCWFLREKKSDKGTPLIPKRILSGDASNEDNYYHNVLAPLFFEVLNKHRNSRSEKFREGLYASIPYLNGGLFSPDLDDHYKFDKTLQLSVPGLVNIPDKWLRAFFELLELYNFTVDENTAYDVELSIDPEMLGRIFENLLARINPETGETVRKMTGSFYTPREIVEYMVDESLKQYLKNKTNISENKITAVISYDLSDDKQHSLSDNEKQLITDALGEVKILDPACGSGAFPIGILQKIVFVLQQVDPDSKKWIEKQLHGASPELRHHLEREYKNNNFNYLRKLGVIRESIYGVDIQPIATEISRLRCFLTLIVDQSVNDKDDNRGVEPLPNLDFKFVTSNSLIGLEDEEHIDIQTGLFEDTSGIDELRRLRNEYFSSHNHERDSLKLQFSERQNQMLQDMIASHSAGFSNLTQKLSTWKPFSHSKTDWFDPEWMFGINEGFDIVIANPPYINIANLNKDDREKYKKLYPITKNKVDLYAYFIVKGSSLLSDGAVLTYIVPHTWKATTSFSRLRDYIFKQFHLLSVTNLEYGAFEATVKPLVIMLRNSRLKDYEISVYDTNFKRINTINSSEVFEDPELSLDTYSSSQDKSLFKKIEANSIQLGAICKFTRGIKTSDDSRFISKKQLNQEYRKVIRGRNITPYHYDWAGEYIWYRPDLMREKAGSLPHSKELFEVFEKIVLQRISKGLVAAYDDKQIYSLDTSLVSVQPILDSKYSLKFLLAIINSKLANYWYHKKFPLPTVSGYELHKLPIKHKSDQTDIISIVDQLLDSNLENTEKLLNRIDEKIYEIYGLSEEEIQRIESSP